MRTILAIFLLTICLSGWSQNALEINPQPSATYVAGSVIKMDGMIGGVASFTNPDAFWVKGRSGLTLLDTIGTNNVSVLLPYLYKPTGNEYAHVNDAGALDIGASDFTICGWFKAEETPIGNYRILAGKKSAVGANGDYNIFVYATNGLIAFYVTTSSGMQGIISTTDFAASGWTFILGDVNQTTHKIRLFINNVQSGSDLTITGTFAASANEFGIGATGNAIYPAKSSHSDCVVLHRLMTVAERANAMLGIFPTDCAAHYPCNSWILHDVSGNGLHMTGVNLTSAKMGYDAKGSQHLLNKGYSLYKSIRARDLYVGYSDAGTALVAPTVPAGYVKATFSDDTPIDIAGNSSYLNLADCMLSFSGDDWDRSNATIFSSDARVVGITSGKWYLSGTPKVWHISLINKDWLDRFHNDGYQNKYFPKVTPNSAYDQKLLTEILGYSTNITGTTFKNTMRYTKDNNWFHTVDYNFSDTYICAQRGSKTLAFNNSTKVMSLSLDGGVTYSITKDLTGICSLITDAFIFDNGNIIFANHTKYYLSTNNLSTYAETTVLDVAGSAYTPTTYNNFRPYVTNDFTYFGSQEFRVWGCYSTDAGTIDDNINLWFTIDNGTTIKSIYKAGVTNPPLLAATHIHAANFNTADTSLWLQTGDIKDKSNWIKGKYNTGAGTWSFTQIAKHDAASFSKTLGMVFYNNHAFWPSDATGGSFATGIFTAPYSTISDSTTFKMANYIGGEYRYTDLTNWPNNFTWSIAGGVNGNIIAGTYLKNVIYTSSNGGKYFLRHALTGGPTISTQGYYTNWLPQNSSGYFRGDIFEDSENIVNWELGKVINVKIIP